MTFLDAVNRFYYAMSLRELQMMKDDGPGRSLTYTSMLYLNVVAYTPACTVSTLAERLQITKSAVTIKVGELTRQGYLTKTRSEDDKRVHYLTISAPMAALFEQYDALCGDIADRLRQTYTADEMALFCRMLASIAEDDPGP